jgi:predicted DNA-binding transcriptional regulator AlpA
MREAKVKDDVLLTVPEVLEALGDVSRRTFYRWRELGLAPAGLKLPNGEIRIWRSELLLWLESRRSDALEMEGGLRQAKHVWDFRSNEDLATAKATVPAGHKGWVEFRFDQKVEPRKLYWVHAPAAGKIFWRSVVVKTGVSHLTPVGCSAAQKLGKNRWEQQGTGWCLGVKVTPQSKPFGAENVIRGTHRPDLWTNIWISEARLPAHVELKWDGARKFNTVVLTFDTNTGRRENEPLFRYPDCVKDYDLEAFVGGGWKTVAAGRGNYFRRCTHRFERVESERLRLRVLATNGAAMARVYEIRVYDEG